jgi:phi13 family phage major tail protein
MANSQYGELVNLDSLNYALVTADTTATYSTGSVSALAPAGEIQHEAKADINTRYYNGVPMFTSVTEGATSVKITVSGVPMVLAAKLTGKPYDSVHGIMVDTGDASGTPDAALSGRMELGDGGFRYFQYLKGKFSVGAQTAVSRTEKTTEKTVDLTYTAMTTIHQFTMPDASTKGVKGLFADTTDVAFTSGSAWFSQTQTPDTLGAVAAIALSSSVPANNATAVVATVAPVLTFNNAIASDNVILVKTADNSIVEVTKTYNTTGKVLTITPTGALTSAGVYNIIVSGVKDIYGRTLAPSVIKFTVA